MNIKFAYLSSFNTVEIVIDNTSNLLIQALEIKNNDNTIPINQYLFKNNTLQIILREEINIKKETYLTYNGNTFKVNYSPLYKTKEFNKRYYYDGELGVFYHHDYTSFKIWSPVATSCSLLIYENGEPTPNENPKKYKMKEVNGLWYSIIKGNLKNCFYTYEIKVFNNINEVTDPYVKAVGINGLRGAIIDMRDTNPKNFNKDFVNRLSNFTEAIIYETNIRNVSMDPLSGIINKGKFLGLSEIPTFSDKYLYTGLSHIKELGVTHIQLMPIFDFDYNSVDEKKPEQYNWGYDPQNYNVPEGSYSTNPFDPVSRILELKEMIQVIHRSGLFINMDVVYNHISTFKKSNLHNIFPGYYFRSYINGEVSNGSGCGNDIASEHSMVKKFILDSLIYWITEYHIDGFRFDLMGILDVETMNYIRSNLDKFDDRIMLYGEGWNLNTNLADEEKATQFNAFKMPSIGFFNDVIRDSIKGNVFMNGDRGYVSGKEGLENKLKTCITGCTLMNDDTTTQFLKPEQCINYVSAHDNATLWDKLMLSAGEYCEEDRKAMHKLANGIVLTCQGIPFLHAGVEFCDTKNMDTNSYKSSDTVNRMDWNRKADFIDIFNYYKGLIKLRKEHFAFKMNCICEIKDNLIFLDNLPKNCVGFILKDNANGDAWKNILVIYNPNKYDVKITVPKNTWYQTVNKYTAGTDILKIYTTDILNINSISINVYYSY